MNGVEINTRAYVATRLLQRWDYRVYAVTLNTKVFGDYNHARLEVSWITSTRGLLLRGYTGEPVVVGVRSLAQKPLPYKVRGNGIFVLRKKGSKTKERMKDEEIEEGDCGRQPEKSFEILSDLIYLFVFHSLLRLTSFLSQYKNEYFV